MKKLVFLLLLISKLALADVLLEGPYQINPDVKHKGPLLGVMQVVGTPGAPTGLVFNFEKPLMGKTTHETAESVFFSNLGPNGEKQIRVLATVNEAPHHWIMVIVADSDAQGSVYQTRYFRSNEEHDAIIVHIKDYLTAVPADWKQIGAGQLQTK